MEIVLGWDQDQIYSRSAVFCTRVWEQTSPGEHNWDLEQSTCTQ